MKGIPTLNIISIINAVDNQQTDVVPYVFAFDNKKTINILIFLQIKTSKRY